MKRVIGKCLVWLGTGLMGLAFLVVLTGIVSGWYMYGFSWVRETLSPFNLWNYIATMIVLLPGLCVRSGGQKLLDMARIDAARAQ